MVTKMTPEKLGKLIADDAGETVGVKETIDLQKMGYKLDRPVSA